MDTVKINKNNVKMVAHRGLSGIEKENTCPAFVAAANRSYFGIETDIHVTKDKKFVVIHDETTQRVDDDKTCINVEENDYSALSDVILPDKDGSRCRGDIRIPLLAEYISICKKYNKISVLEIKNHFEIEDLERLVAEIDALEYFESLIFISFDFENCVNMRKLRPDARIQYLVSREVTSELVDILAENKLDIDIHHKFLKREDAELLHSKGIKINCWTCDSVDDAERLVSYGVDYITTNILE